MTLRTDRRDGIATLTLDRPDRGNALSGELVEALLEAVENACGDAGLHTLVLEAAGPHFCTGFDLSDLESVSDGDLLLRFARIETLLAALWHAPIRTIAHAQGRCWGAGADLFAVCEQRLTRPGSTFRFPGAGFGLVLGTRRLAERVGADNARRWVTEGLEIDAATALQCGLASGLVDGGAAMAAVGTERSPADSTVSWPAPGAPAVDRATAARIRAATRADHRDSDLAALVRSAAEPGLKQRIAAYRERVRQSTAKKPK